MSDAPPLEVDPPFDGEDLSAAEYALGVLDRAARSTAEARSARDPDFAARVLAWVLRFEPLIGEVASVEPSAGVWSRIETAIDERPALKAASSEPPEPANDVGSPASQSSAHSAMGLWRTWAPAASAVAAVAVLFIAVRPMLAPSGPGGQPGVFASKGTGRTLVATLALTQSKASAFTVAYDPGQSTLYATPAADFSIPRARSAELWLIPADGKPRPMGVVDVYKPITVAMPAQYKGLAQDKATLAISIEPLGGSTTGLPTGPVVAAGKFAVV